MDKLVKSFMNSILSGAIRTGQLRVIWPDGTETTYGAGAPTVGVKIHDNATLRRLVFNPSLTVGESYVDGGLTLVGCTLYEVLDVLMTNVQAGDIPVLDWHQRFANLREPFRRSNSARRSRRNVKHHYDLNGRLYSLFLDRDRQYSCAYFEHGDETLEAAQAAKKRHIAAKLHLTRPGLTVLDIGCGWGGMALTLAREYGARVHGITLSEEQLTEARARAASENLADRVTFELADYRGIDRQFDRVVSVGMFEHVGVPNYPTYFETIRRCLKPDGVALIHSIGRFGGPATTNDWVAKYIFPGGYSPAMSEVMPALERAGLLPTDLEILRLHYAQTLSHWRRRFAANRGAIAALYDERFCRMFEFYLTSSELAFRVQDHMNFQIQLVRDQNALPTTRAYMQEEDHPRRFAAASD